MHRYGSLSGALYAQLQTVTPSQGGSMIYYPCAVTLADGSRRDCVYVSAFEPYIQYWGVAPEDDSGKRSVRIEEVVAIEESPYRLPVSFANQLYAVGETGMGYTIFTLVFRDGQRQAYLTGNAVDFIQLPEGKTASDIVDVMPHEGRTSPDRRNGERYFWCLYAGVEDAG